MQELNPSKIQDIIRNIVDEEKKIHNLGTDITPITIIQFYKDYASQMLKSDSPLKTKFNIIKLPITASGVYLGDTETKEGNIFLFQKYNKKIKPLDKNIYKAVFTCYHEIGHAIQANYDSYSYDGFLRDIDRFIQEKSIRDFSTQHSKYSFEIGANLYGSIKAKEYIKTHYPDLYEQEKEYIEKREQQQKFYYMTYDASDTIERMITAAKKEIKNDNVTQFENMNNISPVLEIFLNNDMGIKSISEIIQHDKFRTLDKRIVYAFFSCRTFLENINIEQLSDEELNLLAESLQYSNTVYQNQFNWLEQEKSINLIDTFKTEKSILQKCSVIANYYTSKIIHKLNYGRSYNERNEDIERVSENLENAKALIRKRKIGGYLVINYFYIIGFIISILTISYLLINR